MIRATLTKVAEKVPGSLFPMGFSTEGILVDKEGNHLKQFADIQGCVYLKTPGALTRFNEKPYHFSTDTIVSVEDSGGRIETVSGHFVLTEITS